MTTSAPSTGRVDLRSGQRRAGNLLVAPAYTGIVITALVPLLAAFALSFTSYGLLEPPQWVGLRNYRTVLGDPVYWESLRNTVSFAFGQVLIGIVVTIFVALLFNRALFGGAVMRTIVYIPQAASYVVVALMWNLLLDPAVGPINAALGALGVDHPVYFLTDSSLAMPSIIVMSLWRNLGYFMIIVLAALQSVPEELTEAAMMDGAGPVRRFFAVTLPSISKVVSFVAITWFLGALQMFTQSYVMTGGGPVNATRTLVYLMYDEAFLRLDIGTACAIAVMLFVLVVVLSVLLRVLLRTRKD
ncbi:carbohydrate ABC transporter permease [Ruania alba]|uniref:carbohydrate ABC transporter permease n=1 Tax=Ruania alba TaxID=648782 RepID=UPI001FDF7448|nr:sugar ABC transporter permease [Ruania alba]